MSTAPDPRPGARRGACIAISAFSLLLGIGLVVASGTWSPARAATITWTGLGATTNWNLATNWSTVTVPGAADVAVFDGTSPKPVLINANVNVAGLQVTPAYGGTVTQGAGRTITLGANGWAHSGVFNGSDAAITINGPFTLSGGVFTATSGIMSVGGDFTHAAGSFAHNAGTLRFTGAAAAIDLAVSLSVWNLGLAQNNLAPKTLAAGDTLMVDGLLTLTNGTWEGGELHAHGDIVAASAFDGGTATLRINGAGNQLLTGSATTTVGALPTLVIDKPSGTLSLAGTIRTLRDWTYAAGLLNAGTSNVVFSGTQTIAGSHSLAGVELRNALVRTLAPGTTLTVTGLLRLNDGELNGGDSLDAHGDIVAASAFDGGTATLRINGAGNQLLTGSATTTVGALPTLVIDKPSGTLSLAGTIRTLRDWTYAAGLLNAGTSNVVFSGTQTIAGSHSLAGVELRNALVRTLAPGTTLTVTGLLRLNDGELNGGDSLDAHGDIVAASAFDGGTATLRINGAGNQLLTGSATTTVGALPTLVIDKPSGTLSLAGTIRTLRDWTYAAGLLNAGTSNVVFSGTQTIAGSHSLAGVELRNALVRTLAPGTTLTVTGLLRLNDGELNGGDSLDAHGDIVAASAFDGGTATLRINGAGNQLLTGSATTTVGALPTLVIDKPSGTLSLAGTIRTLRDWTYAAGLLNAGTSTLILAGTETLTTGAASLYRLQVRGGTATLAGPLTLTNDLNVVAGTFNLDGNPVDVAGSLTVAGTLIADGTELRVAGNVTAPGSFQAGTGRLVLDGTLLQQLDLVSSALNDLTLDNAAGASLLTDLAVGGTLELASGSLTIGAHRLTIAMPIEGTATSLVAGSSSSLTVAGTAAGISVPTSIIDLAELSITNPAGTSIGGPLTLHVGLVLGGGNLHAGPHLVTIAAGGSVGRTSGHVIGALQKSISVGGPLSLTFEIGDASGYTPVQASWVSVSAAGTIAASTEAGDDVAGLTATGLVPTASVNRTWTLVAGSGVVVGPTSVNVTFLASDLDPAARPMDLLAVSSSGGGSTLAAVTQRTPTTTTLTLEGAPNGTIALGMPGADLGIGLTGPTSGTVDQPLAYIVTITNNGPFDASLVTARITLPAASAPRSTMPSQGTCQLGGTVLTCDLGPMASGSNASVGFTVAFASAGSHQLAAAVSVGGTAVDPTAPNDSTILDVAISQPTPASTGIRLLPDTSTPLGWAISLALLAVLAMSGVVLTAIVARVRSSSRR